MRPNQVLPDIVGFLFILAFAFFQEWEAKDLIWGMWTSSLVVGYATIVVTIVKGVLQGEGNARLILACGGVFMLAFFTVHFGMFHFVHSMFLNSFFPITEESFKPDFGPIVRTAVTSYWAFILASLISRVPALLRQKVRKNKADPFARPYVNVVRMHILIFVFAGLHGLGLKRYALYPVLLFYFFPWDAFLLVWRRRRKAQAEVTTGGGNDEI